MADRNEIGAENMIFTVTTDKKFYASVEYDKKTRILKLLKATDQAMADDLANKLKQQFSVYDPRDGNTVKTPKDAFQAFLCIRQALFDTPGDNDITADEEIKAGIPPIDPDVVY